MKELELQFERLGEMEGFIFNQYYKSDLAYIYAVTHKESGVTNYEVFERIEYPEQDYILKGKKVHTEAKVAYPSSNAFGLWAFCCKSPDRAMEKFYELEEKIKQRKLNKDENK